MPDRVCHTFCALARLTLLPAHWDASGSSERWSTFAPKPEHSEVQSKDSSPVWLQRLDSLPPYSRHFISVLQLGEARPGKVEIMYFTIIYPKPHLNFVAPLSLKLLPPTTVPNVISFFSISTVSFKNNKQTTKPQLPITWWRILQSKYAVRHTIKFKSLIIINKKA